MKILCGAGWRPCYLLRSLWKPTVQGKIAHPGGRGASSGWAGLFAPRPQAIAQFQVGALPTAPAAGAPEDWLGRACRAGPATCGLGVPLSIPPAPLGASGPLAVPTAESFGCSWLPPHVGEVPKPQPGGGETTALARRRLMPGTGVTGWAEAQSCILPVGLSEVSRLE